MKAMTAEEAFETHHRAIFGFVYRLTGSVELAQDITQDCFLALLRFPGRFDQARGSLRTYLFSIARNLALRHCRDDRVEASLEDEAEPADNTGLDPALKSAVQRAVASLPVLQQEALILFEYEGFTLEQIAAVADCDVGTVKSRLHRARARLKRILAPYRSGVGGVHGSV